MKQGDSRFVFARDTFPYGTRGKGKLNPRVPNSRQDGKRNKQAYGGMRRLVRKYLAHLKVSVRGSVNNVHILNESTSVWELNHVERACPFKREGEGNRPTPLAGYASTTIR